MTANGWLQIIVYFVLILAITKPLGVYMHRVFEGPNRPLPRVLGPVERLLLRLCGVRGDESQTWKGYTVYLLAFSAIGVIVTYLFQRLQHVLPLNPQHLGAVSTHSSFNTAVSFTTNTNWQGYAGESTMSYLTQMAGLAWHNFTSAGAGICVALVLARGLDPAERGHEAATASATSSSTWSARSSTCCSRSASCSAWSWRRAA